MDRLIVGCAGHAALVTALGEPYAAPELAAATAREGRPSADVRALGVLIVELLAGRAVGEDQAPREVLRSLGVAEPARTLLAAALAPEPSRRPMDVVRFATDVGDCLRTSAVLEPKAAPAKPAPPSQADRAAAAAGAASGAVRAGADVRAAAGPARAAGAARRRSRSRSRSRSRPPSRSRSRRRPPRRRRYRRRSRAPCGRS